MWSGDRRPHRTADPEFRRIPDVTAVLTSPDDGSERIRGAIPPVTGTKIGTQVIADGQTITVDGDAGEVLIG
jgi:hypothetical protein